MPAFLRITKSKILAILLVSTIFSLLHLLNLCSGAAWGFVLLQVALAFFIALILGALYLKKGIWSCIALHGLISCTLLPLYIDPGTGSMLFTILIGLLGVFRYLLRTWFVKAKFLLGAGGKGEQSSRVPLVIFSDDKRYWQNFEPVCRELAKRDFPVLYLTMSQDDNALQCSYSGFKAEFIGSGNGAFAKMNFINAKLVLSTTPGLEVFQWKRSPEVDCYIHLPHASTDITLYHMFGIDYYDALLLSGEYQVQQVRALEHLRSLPSKETALIGIPYLDEMKERLCLRQRDEANLQKETPTVLLAPSWGKSGILSKFGSKIIDALLATGYHLIIRPHPQSYTSEKELMENLEKRYPATSQLEWNRDKDNFEVLSRSDILISDFSGVIFDYAMVFDRPVIYTDTEFDKSPYDAWWLDEEPWVFRALPRIGEKLSEENIPKVKELIDTCLRDNKYAEGREWARGETWSHIGSGATLAADWIIKKASCEDKVKSL